MTPSISKRRVRLRVFLRSREASTSSLERLRVDERDWLPPLDELDESWARAIRRREGGGG